MTSSLYKPSGKTKFHFLYIVHDHCQIKDAVQDEAERLAETVRATFSLEPLPESFHIDETDFVHGLPKVLLLSSLNI